MTRAKGKPDRNAAHRAYFTVVAAQIAESIVTEKGEVSTNDVWDTMVEKATVDLALSNAMIHVDKRCLGALFRTARGWERVRWNYTGSHGRPIPVWAKKKNP